jgi:hypothetical protein
LTVVRTLLVVNEQLSVQVDLHLVDGHVEFGSAYNQDTVNEMTHPLVSRYAGDKGFLNT